MPATTRWREFLGKYISNTQERQRIANELNVSMVTLARWANGTSNPRPQNLRQLLRTLPQHRTQLLALISEEYPDLVPMLGDDQEKDASQEIPGELYVNVMHAYATLPQVLRFWGLSNLILLQALGQLDPNQLGLAVSLVQCMPPSSQGVVRSLRERVGYGTSPWAINLEQEAIFLGRESMAGFAAMNGRSLIRQHQEEHEGFYPAHWSDWEVSAAAYPILRSGAVAGSLVVSSTQPNYFVPFRTRLIEQYSELLSLVFEQKYFYALDTVMLCDMPKDMQQREYLATLHKRAVRIMNEAMKRNEMMTMDVATDRAWQELEELFLDM
jgi:transcriptional regulator with XRE-family HTH domain